MAKQEPEFDISTLVGDGGMPIVKVNHELGLITAYPHFDADGTRFLVVDIDHESDCPFIRVYVNDGEVFDGRFDVG